MNPTTLEHHVCIQLLSYNLYKSNCYEISCINTIIMKHPVKCNNYETPSMNSIIMEHPVWIQLLWNIL